MKEKLEVRSMGGFYFCVFYSQGSGSGSEAVVDQKDADGQPNLSRGEQRRVETR